jgi:hypothetical protein
MAGLFGSRKRSLPVSEPAPAQAYPASSVRVIKDDRDLALALERAANYERVAARHLLSRLARYEQLGEPEGSDGGGGPRPRPVVELVPEGERV